MKIFRTILCVILTFTLLAIAFVVFVLIVPTHNNAYAIGSVIGQTTGTWIGTAIGSFNGITVEAQNGYEDGKADGLSAEDTDLIVIEDKYSLGTDKLQVLTANISVNNKIQVGEDAKTLYAILLEIEGKINFTIDLAAAKYEYEEDVITIIIPDTVASVYLDEGNEHKVLAEYQKSYSKSGDYDSVLDGLINERSTILDNVESIDNYEELHKLAKDSAKKQVEALAKSSTVNKQIIVKFEDE